MGRILIVRRIMGGSCILVRRLDRRILVLLFIIAYGMWLCLMEWDESLTGFLAIIERVFGCSGRLMSLNKTEF